MTASSEILRVLLASGRKDTRAQAQCFLETADYEVELVELESAADSCNDGDFGLLILDVPGSLEQAARFVQRVREQPAGRALPLMVALDEVTADGERRAQAAGADDCVPWSLSRSEFLWRVRSLLRQRREGGAADPEGLLRIQREELLALSRRREETQSLLVHDMKNPLAGAISNAEYLTTSPGLDDDQVGCAQDILQASRRLHRMVLSLLDVTQSEDGRLRPLWQPILVRDLIDETHSACSARLRDKHLGFEVVCPDARLSVPGDHDMLLRLLANLLDNAIVAAPSGTSVELSALQLGAALELRFSDQGPSVPVAERAQLLSEVPPARGTPEAQRPRRRGFGLRACRVITEAHGGKIWIEDRQPRGVTVAVRLPLTRQ